MLKIFVDPEVTRQIQQSRDSKQLLDFLMKGYNFKPEMIDVCYNFAKFQVVDILTANAIAAMTFDFTLTHDLSQTNYLTLDP